MEGTYSETIGLASCLPRNEGEEAAEGEASTESRSPTNMHGGNWLA